MTGHLEGIARSFLESKFLYLAQLEARKHPRRNVFLQLEAQEALIRDIHDFPLLLGKELLLKAWGKILEGYALFD